MLSFSPFLLSFDLGKQHHLYHLGDGGKGIFVLLAYVYISSQLWLSITGSDIDIALYVLYLSHETSGTHWLAV